MLANVEPQAEMYADGLPDIVPAFVRPLPFVYADRLPSAETPADKHLRIHRCSPPAFYAT